MTALAIALLIPVVIATAFFCGALMLFGVLALGETKRPTDSGDE